jgi:predicted RNA-binding Zn-ribbon protein involved in translation (DUF1610 family)
MTVCPKCGSANIHRSRSRSRWETWRKEITGKRVFRCLECSWRGWGADEGPTATDVEREIAARAAAPDPPNLKDTALARNDRRVPIDISNLDY